jgi:hypothetical protein
MSDPGKRERDRRYNAKRPPWVSWYKTKDWRIKAARQLKAHPWCAMCLNRGVRTAAVIADHVDRHAGDWAKFWRGDLQSLCKHHHDSIKQSIERSNRAGCDEAGLPTDPNHPWA